MNHNLLWIGIFSCSKNPSCNPPHVRFYDIMFSYFRTAKVTLHPLHYLIFVFLAVSSQWKCMNVFRNEWMFICIFSNPKVKIGKLRNKIMKNSMIDIFSSFNDIVMIYYSFIFPGESPSNGHTCFYCFLWIQNPFFIYFEHRNNINRQQRSLLKNYWIHKTSAFTSWIRWNKRIQ